MEAIITERIVLCPQSPPSKVALTLDGQRSELLLPLVSKLAHDNSHHYGDPFDQHSMTSNQNEGERFGTPKKSLVIEDNEADQIYLHSSQGYNPEHSIKTKEQGQNNDDVEFKDNNLNPYFLYSFQGKMSKGSGSREYNDKISDKNKMNTFNSRIHKTPVTRQDSVAFDIKLDNFNETPDKSNTETNRRGGNWQKQELHNTYNNISRVHFGLHEENPYTSVGQRQTKTKQNLPSDANSTLATERGKMHDKTQLFFKSVADSGWEFAENNAASKQVKTQSDKKFMKSHPFVKNGYSDKSKSTDSTKQNCSSEDKQSGTTRAQQLFQYGVLIVMIIFMAMLVHLHTRVAALERSGVSSTLTGCQCHKTIMTQQDHFMHQRLDANSEIVDFNSKDGYDQVMAYFDNRKREPSAVDDISKPSIGSEGNRNIPSNKKHLIFRAGQRDNKSIGRMQPGNPATTGNFKSKSKNVTDVFAEVLNKASNDSSDLSSSTDRNSAGKTESKHTLHDTNFKPVDKLQKFNNIQHFELTDFTRDTTGQKLFRTKRSKGKKVRDPNITGKEKRSSGTQVETFDVPFFDVHFHFPKHFTSQGTSVFNDPLSKHKDCTTRHTWGHGIEACKDTRIIFPEKHSVLPFFRPTNTSVNKDSKKQMISVDKSGKFKVNIAGDYLFQLNITILSESEKHFLALYLNTQATFACQHGGFVCPHINEDHSIFKYKVCTIIGVLELQKDDILDIRTMEPHMTVRAEVHRLRKSQIKFILLNKRK